MKCPHLKKTEQVEEHTYARDDGQVDFEECKVVYVEGHTECIGCECGAWEDGKCRYRG